MKNIKFEYNIPSFYIPLIDQEQLKNAKLYSNRNLFLLDLKKNIDVLEIGTLGGEHAEIINNIVNPKRLDLIDLFNCDDLHNNNFTKQNHFEYVKNKFTNNKNIFLYQGFSCDILKTLNHPYDYIYIDASHDYNSVKNDFLASSHLFKYDTIIGFNDYIIQDLNGYRFGVINFINQFLSINKDWEVIGFAFNPMMYSDIYIRKFR